MTRYLERHDDGRGYEMAAVRGRGGIEFGSFGGSVGAIVPAGRKGAPDGDWSAARSASAMRDRVIVGCAAAALKAHTHKGAVEVFGTGCFTASLQSGRPVVVLREHRYADCLGGTADGRLELIETDEGLLFSFRPPDDAEGRALVADVEAGRLRLSASYDSPAETERRSVGGDEFTLIRSAKLREISFVRNPAVKQTWAFAVDTKNFSGLKAEATSPDWLLWKMAAMLKSISAGL